MPDQCCLSSQYNATKITLLCKVYLNNVRQYSSSYLLNSSTSCFRITLHGLAVQWPIETYTVNSSTHQFIFVDITLNRVVYNFSSVATLDFIVIPSVALQAGEFGYLF